MVSALLTITKGEGHGLVPTVGQRSIPPPVSMLYCVVRFIVFAFVTFRGFVAGADAYDAVHQSTLRFLLLQVVVLSNAVDQVADLNGFPGEGHVGCAFGKLLDLVHFIKF